MSGIFGVHFWNGGENIEQSAKSLLLASQQGFHHPEKYHLFRSGAIGSAVPHFYSATQWPLVTKDGLYALSVLGEIYLPNGAPLRETNFEEGFIRPFLHSPKEFLRTLDGAFQLAMMSDAECWLATDPFGTFALHYFSSQSKFIFSTQGSALSTALEQKGLDEQGILQYIGLGQTLRGRTLFSHINRLGAGTLLHAFANGLTRERYYAPRYQAEVAGSSVTLERIRSAFETSVIQRSQYPNATAALTGGFDSRATWSILLKHNIPMVAHAHGLPNCSDLIISSRIAKAQNIQQDNILFDEHFLQQVPDHWSEIVRLSEGAISMAHAPTLMAWKGLSKRHSVLLDSYGGTFYRRQRMKVAERMIDPNKDLVPQLLNYERSPLLNSNLLSEEFSQTADKEIERALREYYNSISDTSLLGNKLDRYHFEEVDTMRDALMANAQMNFIGLAHPFMTLRAIELAATLPLRLRKNDAAHKNIVHNEFVKLERFPMDNVGFVTPYRGFSTLRYGAMAVERLLRTTGKIFPSVFGKMSLRRPTMDMEHLIRPGLKQMREILLSPHSDYDRVVDRNAVQQALTECENGNFRTGAALIQLTTFRLFLDLFC